jgi:hypothetical protein
MGERSKACALLALPALATRGAALVGDTEFSVYTRMQQ